MTVIVFVGPSVSPEEAHLELDAVYLPPASQGDIYRAVAQRPQAIGIIDGYFEWVPSVWHKEILWAMAQGIHVFGSASMGALRAVELEAFGMEGVGGIFEAYRNGTYEDDDEVAVAHGPAESGYRECSLAMVNFRATLRSAGASGIVSPPTRAILERVAKELFYPDRSYAVIFERAAKLGVPEVELLSLRDWLPSGEVNQKRLDALAMLRVMRERLSANQERKRVRFHFEFTEAWDSARRLAGEVRLEAGSFSGTPLIGRLLDEVRLDGNASVRAQQGAQLRFFLLEEAQRHGYSVTPESLRKATDAFRRERGLLEPADVERWLEQHHLSDAELARLVEDELRIGWALTLAEREVPGFLIDFLRVAGQYVYFESRVRDKQSALERLGLENPSLEDSGLTKDELLSWYFEARLHRPKPADLERYALSVGFEDPDALCRAVLREFCYLRGQPVC